MLRSKYRIDRLLGVGGMASVYAATHRNGRKVAVKLLHPEFSMRADVRARFLAEGQAANAVSHPGAVIVLDDDVAEDGAAFVVMELLEGRVLESIAEEHGQRLPARMVLAIARELCGVLDAAHRAGIVHRDIKPENLFLTSDGQLKVLDFGLAQLRHAASPKLTVTGMIFGTPMYMAPEQADGRTSEIDRRTDLWAVGATMFSLLSGRTVHEGESVQRIVILAATKPARSLRAVLPTAHPAVVALVDRALALDKSARWPDAQAMQAAICETSLLLFGEPHPPIVEPVAPRGVPFVMRPGATSAATREADPFPLPSPLSDDGEAGSLPSADELLEETSVAEITEQTKTRVEVDEPTKPRGEGISRHADARGVTDDSASTRSGGNSWSALLRAIDNVRSLLGPWGRRAKDSSMDSSDEVTTVRETTRSAADDVALRLAGETEDQHTAIHRRDPRPVLGVSREASVSPRGQAPAGAPTSPVGSVAMPFGTVGARTPHEWTLAVRSLFNGRWETIVVAGSVIAFLIGVILVLRGAGHPERAAPVSVGSAPAVALPPASERVAPTPGTGTMLAASDAPPSLTPSEVITVVTADEPAVPRSPATTATGQASASRTPVSPDAQRSAVATPSDPPASRTPPPSPRAVLTTATPNTSRAATKCERPYDVDSTGRKRWKLECL